MKSHVEATDEIRLMSIIAGHRVALLREGAPTLENRRADLLKLKNAISRRLLGA
jgi:hypothetical protein